jgi:hypothetical protein
MSLKNIPLVNLFERATQNRLGQRIIYFGLIPLLLLSVLLLPPLSLAGRLLSIGYEPIETGGSVIQGPDGVQVTFLPAGVKDLAWLKLEVVPPALFATGAADRDSVAAAEKLPAHLTIASPLYRFRHRGAAPAAVVLTIPLPTEAGPPQTLDLYTWNGQTWEWLPHRKIPAKNVFEAELDFLPQTVALMQTQTSKLRVSSDAIDETVLPAEVKDVITEIAGLTLEANGQLSNEK